MTFILGVGGVLVCMIILGFIFMHLDKKEHREKMANR